MAYNEKLSDRIRERLVDIPKVEEKLMFGGVFYMVNGKMCVGVIKDEMMCRIDPDIFEEALERDECRPLDSSGKSMKGFVFVNEYGINTKKDFEYWIALCLEYNKQAKASPKKKIKRTQ